MNIKVVNAMGVAGILVALMFGFAAMSYVSSYASAIQPSSFRSFSVTGDGKAVGIPDVATFSFGVKTEGGKDIGALQKDNTSKINKAIAYLKTSGVAAKDITTENYDLSPRYQYYNCGPSVYDANGNAKPCPPSEIVGYTISQDVLVKVRDFAKIGDVLSGVVANGANTTSGLSFAIDDSTKLQDEARAEAIAKAQAKATAIASASGFRLGRLLSIDESSNAPQPMYYGGFAPAALKESASRAPTIEPGSKDIKVAVTLRYEIR